MRFSPYPMSEYVLQTMTTRLSPLQFKANDICEAEWNLLWASLPELDDFLNLRRDDFRAFNQLIQVFPYKRGLRVRDLYCQFPAIYRVLSAGTPREVAQTLDSLAALHPTLLGTETTDWLQTVKSRLAMAQSLLDVKEASAICQNILAVDFKARRRA